MGNSESLLDLEAVLHSFDDVSGTFDIIITYIIHHLVPSYTVKIQAMSAQQQSEDLDDLSPGLASGSEAEGLQLRHAIPYKHGDRFENSDLDTMFIKPYHAAETLQQATEAKAILYLDTSETYPGYVRVKWVNPVENVYYTHQQANIICDRSSSLTDNIKPNSAEGSSASNVKLSQTGPFTKVERARVEVNPGNYKLTCMQPRDDIPALPLKGWPSFIRKPKEKSLFNTVYHHMISKAEYKCQFHLVPIAHPSSTDPDIEWRISCSYIELLLCEKLTLVQRQAYLAFKFLAKEATKEHKVIKTYHMKTAFFWVLETAPSDLWEDMKLARCLYALLDKFIGFLADRKLPHYFIPGNNLVGHLSDDQIKPALHTLQVVRKDPVGHIMKFQKKVRLKGQSLNEDHGLEKSILPFIDKASECLAECKTAADSQNFVLYLVKLMHTALSTEITVCYHHLQEDRVWEAFHAMFYYLYISKGAAVPTLWHGHQSHFPVQVEDFYRFFLLLFHFCTTAPMNETPFYFLNFIYKDFKVSGMLDGTKKQRVRLLEVILHNFYKRFSEDEEKVKMITDQCAVVFESLVEEQKEEKDVVTLCEYLCFFSELWTERVQNVNCKTFLSEARKFLKVLGSLISLIRLKMCDRKTTMGGPFYCVNKLCCLDDEWTSNTITFFTNTQHPVEVPHEIFGLYVGIMTVCTILIPKARALMLQMDGCYHSMRTDLEELLKHLNEQQYEAQNVLNAACSIIPCIPYPSFDKNVAFFLQAQTMMGAGVWGQAHEILAQIDENDIKIAKHYQNICKLVLYLHLKLPNDMDAPETVSSTIQNAEEARHSGGSGLLYNPDVDLATYGCVHVKYPGSFKTYGEYGYLETTENSITLNHYGITKTVPYDCTLHDPSLITPHLAKVCGNALQNELAHKHIKMTGVLVGQRERGVKLIMVILHDYYTRFDTDEVSRRLKKDQSAVVFDALVKEQKEEKDVVTLCEYLCFFSKLWKERFQNVDCKSLLSEARKFVKVMKNLLSTLKASTGLICSIKRLDCYDEWEANIASFITHRDHTVDVPLDIAGLFRGILTERTVLIPKARTHLSQMEGGTHSERAHLEELLADLNEQQYEAQITLYNIMARKPNPSYDRNCACFLHALTLMYTGKWEEAHKILALVGENDIEIARRYQNICILVILHLDLHGLPDDMHTPEAVSSTFKTGQDTRRSDPSNKASSGLLYDPEVDMSRYISCLGNYLDQT